MDSSREQENIRQRVYQAKTDNLTDEQLVALGAKSDEDYRRKLAEFNAHKQRIQREQAQIKAARLAAQKNGPYSGYVKRDSEYCRRGHCVRNRPARADGSKLCRVCYNEYNKKYKKQNIKRPRSLAPLILDESGTGLARPKTKSGDSKRKMKKKSAKSASKNIKRSTSKAVYWADLAAQIKLAAMRGLSVAEAEAELLQNPKSEFLNPKQITNSKKRNSKLRDSSLDIRVSLNEIFMKNPHLKIAWERGRFLHNLAACSAKGTTVADAEHDMNMPAGELEKILAADFEAADVWNQSLAKALNFLRGKMLEKVEDASVPALKMMYQMLRRQIVTAAIDYTHITTQQLIEITGKTRTTVHDWVMNKGCPRNSDKTFNLKTFLDWFENFTVGKVTPATEKSKNPLSNIKAARQELEFKKEIGELLTRTEVVAGFAARAQLLKNLHDKRVDQLPQIMVNQPEGRLMDILAGSFEEIRTEFISLPLDLKLDEEEIRIFREFLELITTKKESEGKK